MKKKNLLPSDLAALVSSTIAEVTPAAAPKTPKVKTGKKRIPMARVFIDGAIAIISDTTDSVSAYLSGFLALPPRSKAGYDNFWSNDDGFTNRQKFRNISVQGVAKMTTVLKYQAARIIAEGGDDAKAMELALAAIDGFYPTMLEQALADKNQDDFTAAFKALVNDLPDEKFPTALDKYNKAVEALKAHAEENELELPAPPTDEELEVVVDGDTAEDEVVEGDVLEDATA